MPSFTVIFVWQETSSTQFHRPTGLSILQNHTMVLTFVLSMEHSGASSVAIPGGSVTVWE